MHRHAGAFASGEQTVHDGAFAIDPTVDFAVGGDGDAAHGVMDGHSYASGIKRRRFNLLRQHPNFSAVRILFSLDRLVVFLNGIDEIFGRNLHFLGKLCQVITFKVFAFYLAQDSCLLEKRT